MKLFIVYVCLISIMHFLMFPSLCFLVAFVTIIALYVIIESETWASRAPNAVPFFNNPLSDGLMLSSRSLALSWLMLLFT